MFEKRRFLFVEDDRTEILAISSLLKALKADFFHTATVSEAIRELASNPYDYVLTDLHIETKAGLEKPDGLTVIRAAVEQQPNVTIVATSSDPRTEVVESALACGAHHFIRKPLSKSDEIEIAFKLADQRRLLARTADKSSRTKKPTGQWEKYSNKYPYGIVQGEREQKIARLAARKKASCVITGETGTGKEELAKLIHRIRCESEGPIPIVALNCATLSENLAESTLFGHRKGAFTGASEAVTGYIAEADGGILFLDEIQTLSISIQQKLLRVLNDGTYNRLGETKLHRSNFQLIAATTKDLSREVEEGRFLLDIQMRMMGIELAVSPLRERLDELPALVALFFHQRSIELEQDLFARIVEKLRTYKWPGNIRQLFKCMEAWLLYCELDEISIAPENFPVFKDLQQSQVKGLEASAQGIVDLNAAINEDHDYEKIVVHFEKTFLRNALHRHRSISDCCKAINLSRSTLDSKRKKYGLL